MSSNLELKRICQQCGKEFVAKKTSTKFCSFSCGQRNYKARQRMNKIETENAKSQDQSSPAAIPMLGRSGKCLRRLRVCLRSSTRINIIIEQSATLVVGA